ncbi:MAG: hypothetical protein HC880_15905, partial [Bacteroidia bacterium]|nr:hypothetical protein [Bacteroidia bacterium]
VSPMYFPPIRTALWDTLFLCLDRGVAAAANENDPNEEPPGKGRYQRRRKDKKKLHPSSLT